MRQTIINLLIAIFITGWTTNAVCIWKTEQLVMDYHLLLTCVLTLLMTILYFTKRPLAIWSILVLCLLYALGIVRPSWFYEERSFFISFGSRSIHIGYINLLFAGLLLVMTWNNKALVAGFIRKYILN